MIEVVIRVEGDDAELDVKTEGITKAEAGIFLMVLREAKKKVLKALEGGEEGAGG